jgi:NADPH-dependent curcumin reductase CurA
MITMNSQILLVSRPSGEAVAENFRLIEAPLPALRDGQVLVRHHFISVDPYMRGRMNDTKSYAAPQPLNAAMQGGTVGEVVKSKHASYQSSDKVVGLGGWQQYSIVDGTAPGVLRKVDTTYVPLSAYLGAVGMPGVTAWYDLTQICLPEKGRDRRCQRRQRRRRQRRRANGQGARLPGCGHRRRQRQVRLCGQRAGFRCLCRLQGTHRSEVAIRGAEIGDSRWRRWVFRERWRPDLRRCAGAQNVFGRIALCGMISGYDGAPIPLNQPQLIVRSRLTLRGFIVTEHMEHWPQALKELSTMVMTGKLKYRETVAQGLASAPEALLGLLKGRNFGKQPVKLV